MSISDKISSVSPHDLDELLNRAISEQWSQLTLFGPPSHFGYEGLPEKIRQSENVYRLSESVEGIATKLQSLTNLRSLNLRGNDIGDEGARAVAALTNLTLIDLRDNDIGDEGARALLDTWSNASGAGRLMRLDLRKNSRLGSVLPPEVRDTADAQAILSAYRR